MKKISPQSWTVNRFILTNFESHELKRVIQKSETYFAPKKFCFLCFAHGPRTSFVQIVFCSTATIHNFSCLLLFQKLTFELFDFATNINFTTTNIKVRLMIQRCKNLKSNFLNFVCDFETQTKNRNTDKAEQIKFYRSNGLMNFINQFSSPHILN